MCFLLNGNLCKNFTAPDGRSSESIFLSTLGIVENVSHDFIPVSQISSDDHSYSEINRFFF